MQITEKTKAKLPTKYAEFNIYSYSFSNGENALCLVHGQPQNDTLVRIHSECATGDIFQSLRCDCGDQLDQAMKKIAQQGNGMIIYLHQEGRGIGLKNKIKAYTYQDQGMDTVQANQKLGFNGDERKYETASLILKDLNIQSIQLMTNNPRKIEGMQNNDITVTKRIPVIIPPNHINRKYIQTKKEKMGHLFND